jgi:hypothetical protein
MSAAGATQARRARRRAIAHTADALAQNPFEKFTEAAR